MKCSGWAILAILVVHCSGCAHRIREANNSLEQENFLLEQKIDSLTWQLEDTRSELEACRRRIGGVECGEPAYESSPRSPRRESDIPRSAPREQDRGMDAAPIDRPPVIELPDEGPTTRGTSLPRVNVPRFEGYPEISPPDPNVPDGILEAPPSEPAEPSPPRAHLREPEVVPAPAPSRQNSRSSRKLISNASGGEVSLFAVNPKLTVWHKAAPSASGSALTVVVEPRDQAGNLTETTGDIAIVVLDPSQSGGAARIARWDFKADEAATHFQSAADGGGFHFDLNWPKSVPTAERLDLFVRLTLPDGRQFVAEYSLIPEMADAASALMPVPEDDDGPSIVAQQPRAVDANRWQRARR